MHFLFFLFLLLRLTVSSLISQLLSPSTRANIQPYAIHLLDLESTENADVVVSDGVFKIHGGNAIHVAAALGAHRLVNELLRTHRDFPIESRVESIDSNYEVDGATAVHIAAVRGDIEMLSVLLKWDADINALSRDGMDALLFAADQGNLPMIRLLLSEGGFISPESRKKNAESHSIELHSSHPIHLAALSGHHEVVLEILKTGKIDINLKSHFGTGDTALHAAAQSGNLRTVQVLMENGADIAIKSSDGLTALDLAKQEGHQPVIDYLEKRLNEPHEAEINSKPIDSNTQFKNIDSSDSVSNEPEKDNEKINKTQLQEDIEEKDNERAKEVKKTSKIISKCNL